MINVNLDARDVLEGLANIYDHGQSLPMDEIAEILLKSVQENFAQEGRPNRWAPRKEYGDGHPLLNDTGNLIDSLETRISGEIVEVINTAPYAGYLNEGTSRMEERPFMLIQDEDMDAIEELLAKHFS